MPKKRASESVVGTSVLQAIRDILANLSAEALSNPTIPTLAGAAGTASATFNPALLLILPFLSLTHWLNRRDAKKSEDLQRLLHRLFDRNADAERKAHDAEFVQQFDANIDHERMLARLALIRDLLSGVTTTQSQTAEELGRLADLLHDQRDDRLVLERIFCSRFDQISSEIAELRGVYEEVRKYFDLTPELNIPHRAYDPASPFGALHFSTRGVAFQGRADILEVASKFLLDTDGAKEPRPFSWSLVLAPGGTGKSRFALELCLKYEPLWRVGFLDESELSEFDAKKWKKWQPTEPTLIVVDYVHCYAERVGDIIAILAERNPPVARHVRLLLLERDAPGDWTKSSWGKRFLGSGGRQLSITASHFKCPSKDDVPEGDLLQRPGGSETSLHPLSLPRMDDSELWGILTELLTQLGTPLPDRTHTLRRLTSIDEDARPLFVVLLAYFLAKMPATSEHVWSKSSLLEFTLDRERERWRHRGIDDQHQNLLCLVTLCGRLDRNSKSDPLVSLRDTELFPKPNDFKRGDYEFMSGASADRHIAGLEPDLLGEYFILEHLNSLDSAARVVLLNSAWKTRAFIAKTRTGTAITLLRCVGDFWGTKHSDLADNLLCTVPEDPVARLNWAQFAVDLQSRVNPISYSMLKLLRETSESDPRPELQLLLAVGLVNATVAFGKTQRTPEGFTAFAEFQQELSRLRAKYDSPEIRENLAAALHNAITAYGIDQNFDELRACLDKLLDLCKTDDRPEIREVLADSLVNAAKDYGAYKRFEEMEGCISNLRALFEKDDRPETQELLGKALCNATHAFGTDGRFEALEVCLDQLRAFHIVDDRLEIREILSKALSNAANAYGKGKRIENLHACLREIRALQRNDNSQGIKIVYCRALANAVINTAAAKDLDGAEVLLHELHGLVGQTRDLNFVEPLARAHWSMSRARAETRDFARCEQHLFYVRFLARMSPEVHAFLHEKFPELLAVAPVKEHDSFVR